MNFKPLNNKGISMLVIILAVVVISGIAGAVYLITLNKSMPSNPENKTVTNLENKDNDSSELKCDEDEDFYGCLTLQNYNKSRTVRGLSPIEQDSNLCYIAKILANSINSMPKNYKFNFSLLYQDEVFDKYNGGYDSKGNYNDWRQIYYQYDTYSNIENSQIETTQKEIAETLGRSTREDGETFDKGCFRFSRYEDGNFVLVTVLGQRK